MASIFRLWSRILGVLGRVHGRSSGGFGERGTSNAPDVLPHALLQTRERSLLRGDVRQHYAERSGAVGAGFALTPAVGVRRAKVFGDVEAAAAATPPVLTGPDDVAGVRFG